MCQWQQCPGSASCWSRSSRAGGWRRFTAPSQPARTAAIGLDLEELYGEGEPIPLSVALRQVPPGRDSQPVWVTLRRQRARRGATLDVRLVWDAVAQRFVGELPGQAVGLYEVTVVAREVPQVGDLAVTGTLAVVADD